MQFSLYELTTGLRAFEQAIARSIYRESWIPTADAKKAALSVSLVEEDPGNGLMCSVLKLTTTAVVKEGSTYHFAMEIFPAAEKRPPTFTVTEVTTIK